MTRVDSAHGPCSAALYLTDVGGIVEVQVGGAIHSAEPTDFIAAVEKELDGIFIRRVDLPELIGDAAINIARNECGGGVTADVVRARAYILLAAAEHLGAHPPVDEADVEALALLIFEAHPSPQVGDEIARKILASGEWKRVAK